MAEGVRGGEDLYVFRWANISAKISSVVTGGSIASVGHALKSH